MTAKPVFLLGFGAMKAGTTWLYRYLRDNELVSFGPSKEMHAWTMYFDPSRSRISLRLGNALKGYVCADARRAGVARAELLREVKLTSFGLDPSSYLRLFQQLAASHSRPVADITPDYSRLHPQQVSSIRDFLEPHFELRPLFLMRDPVDRLFSDCKHVARHHSTGSSSDTVVTGVSLFRAKLDRRDRLPGGLKSNYKHVCEMLDAAFGDQKSLYLFYEDLFCSESIRRVTDFIAVPFVEPDPRVRFNADPEQICLAPELMREAVQMLLPVYRFVEARFGSLPRRWQENLSLL